jgi:hypothetical protein
MRLTSRSLRPIIVLATVLLLTASCKKSGGSNGSASNTQLDTAYYMTATVNGQKWTANVNLLNGAAAYAGGASTYILLVGVQAVGKDSTAIEMSFNKAANPGVTSNFNPQYYNNIVYGNASIAYESDPADGASGSFVITQIDAGKGVMAGTFTCTLANTTNAGQKITVTDGKFKCLYQENALITSPNFKE